MIRAFFVLSLSAAALCLLSLASIERDPKVLYNPSPSAPIGWYEIKQSDEYVVGDLVAAWLPKHAEALAHKRGYLPEKTPVIKTIVAVPGDQYCFKNEALKIAGQPDRPLLTTDSQGRALPAKADGCRRLKSGKVLIVSDRIESSFDSRYFGEVEVSAILGHAVFLGKSEAVDQSEKQEMGGARGTGAQGKIKGDGTNRSLSHCLHIDFYSTVLRAVVLADRAFCNDYKVIDGYQVPIDHGISRGAPG